MLTARPSALHRALRQSGLSVVELMVGMAVGLFVIAAASALVAGQLTSNRRLLLDTQIQQDLRATADIIAREVRRAGATQDDGALATLWSPGFTPAINPSAQILSPAPGTHDNKVDYNYQRYPAPAVTYGFQLVGTKIQSNNGATWQDLTDDAVLRVTAFTITARNTGQTTLVCPNDCPGGGQACWPKVNVRDIDIDIEAQAQNDATITRSIRTTVRIRNDQVVPKSVSPASSAPAAIC